MVYPICLIAAICAPVVNEKLLERHCHCHCRQTFVVVTLQEVQLRITESPLCRARRPIRFTYMLPVRADKTPIPVSAMTACLMVSVPVYLCGEQERVYGCRSYLRSGSSCQEVQAPDRMLYFMFETASRTLFATKPKKPPLANTRWRFPNPFSGQQVSQ